MAGLGALAIQTFPAAPVLKESIHTGGKSRDIPLGICNHTLRAMRPTAKQLMEFAIEQKLDSVQFNTLQPFESLEEKHLESLRSLASVNDLSIYVGVGSISEQSVRFSDRFGDASTLLKEGFRVARALKSPVLGVRIGVLEDRYTGGGINPKIDEVVRLMRSCENEVMDSGIRFAFENHAGDMRSEELLELIDRTGKEICGAFFDPGNAIYAMEDPMVALEAVGEHIVCCQARDVVIWQTTEGAAFQWTAVGEGLMDFGFFTSYLRNHCPGVPIHLETISNSPRQIPYLTGEYWKGFPELKATGIVDFLKLVRRGRPIEVASAPEGTDNNTFDTEHQINEFLKSAAYLREKCGVGIKR